jgi:DNA ligase-1
MPDLADGETVEIQGSGSKPYVLKNIGGVYSCSCPAWRNQGGPIERRTCKHLRRLRGDAAEEARLGGALPQRPVRPEGDTGAGPPILLAETWDNATDLSGWWMSEKLDGVRAYWDGRQFLSRQGNLFHAPDWFVEGFPSTPLDGELWLDRKAFQRTMSIVRRQDKNDHWREIRYLVFDAPAVEAVFEDRIAYLKDLFLRGGMEFAQPHEHQLCESVDCLRAELERVEALGGEGLMLREPGSRYHGGRSSTLLKVKRFQDAEAVVIGHKAGAGKHAGRLGALDVQLPDGTRFSVGTGFSDRQRENPPGIGDTITFRYQELSEGGVPRFPSFVRVAGTGGPAVTPHRSDLPDRWEAKRTVSIPAPESAAPEAGCAPRYFEFVGGNSSKFWAISHAGNRLATRWGRIGTEGQGKTKEFADEAAAKAAYEKLIAEKTREGYIER